MEVMHVYIRELYKDKTSDFWPLSLVSCVSFVSIASWQEVVPPSWDSLGMMFKDGSLSLFSPMRQSLSSVNTIYCMNYEPEDRAYVMQRLYQAMHSSKTAQSGQWCYSPWVLWFWLWIFYLSSIYHSHRTTRCTCTMETFWFPSPSPSRSMEISHFCTCALLARWPIGWHNCNPSGWVWVVDETEPCGWRWLS